MNAGAEKCRPVQVMHIRLIHVVSQSMYIAMRWKGMDDLHGSEFRIRRDEHGNLRKPLFESRSAASRGKFTRIKACILSPRE